MQVIIIIDDNRYLIEAICKDGTGWPHHAKTTEQYLVSTGCVNFQIHSRLHRVFDTRSVSEFLENVIVSSWSTLAYSSDPY